MADRLEGYLRGMHRKITGALIEADALGNALPAGWHHPEEIPWLGLPLNADHPQEARVYRYSLASLISYRGLSRAIAGQGHDARFANTNPAVNVNRLPPTLSFQYFEQHIRRELLSGEIAAANQVHHQTKAFFERIYLDCTLFDPSVQLTRKVVTPHLIASMSEGPGEASFFTKSAVVGYAKRLKRSNRTDWPIDVLKYRIIPAAMRRRGRLTVSDMRAYPTTATDTLGALIDFEQGQQILDPAQAIIHERHGQGIPQLIVGDVDFSPLPDDHPWIVRKSRPSPRLSCATMRYDLGSRNISAFSSFCFAAMNLADQWGMFSPEFAHSYLDSLGS